jgi:hypothetical protein
VNLVNNNNDLIVQNFPAISLFNVTARNANQDIPSVQKSGKIIPIYAKLNLRQCYIYIANFTSNDTAIASFTFYHLDNK